MWSVPVTPGGEHQRERAIRLAVNIAMYVLCSNYKDDQVHAPVLMRRRAVDRHDGPLVGALVRPQPAALLRRRSLLALVEHRSAWSSSCGAGAAAACSVAISGLVATALLTLAVLRPATVLSRGSLVGPRVLVLADRSRSLDLPGDEGTRREALAQRHRADSRHRPGKRACASSVSAKGPPRPWDPARARPTPPPQVTPISAPRSMSLAALPEERPAAIVVLSDGRLDRPSENLPGPAVLEAHARSAGAGAHRRAREHVGPRREHPRGARRGRRGGAPAASAHHPDRLRRRARVRRSRR